MALERKVYYRIEQWDGGSGSRSQFHTPHKATAEAWVKANPHDHFVTVNMLLIDSLADAARFRDAEIRNNALQKLTAEERIVLGLADPES
jgi:hypothetical protein